MTDPAVLQTRLAEAEPEQAASFAAALNQIETGRGIDEEQLEADEAFARSLADYSLALSYQRLIRLMLAGLSCGVLWEFWNYGSGAKWIYNIPFFNQWKVFEMPLPGFLGFMPFALECYLFWELFRLARKTPAFTDRRYQALALILVISYCALAFYGIDVMTVIWL